MRKPINLQPLFKAYHTQEDARTEKERNIIAKIAEEITTVEGKAQARCIDPFDIAAALERVENKLNIPKKYMEGIKVDVDIWAQNFPNAYQYKPMSTHFSAEYKNSRWTLTDIFRSGCRRAGHSHHIDLTDTAKQALLDKYTIF